jgi:putative transposase
MARGNGRQHIVRDDVDRDRLQEHLGKAAVRCSWRVFAFAIMSNHLHIVLKTPQPNLARGMQAFLSGYANVWSRRHRFSGHVFQGRYRTELVEDETYLWTVTRYVHLNPVRGRLVEHPTAWAWAGEKLVLTVLEGRFRDACFCGARSNDGASERSLSPPCEQLFFRVY